MSAPTEQEISQAIETAYSNRAEPCRSTPEMYLDNAVNDWLVDLMRALWERWPCDDGRCPARPAADIALGALYAEIEPITEQAADFIRGRFAALAVTFAAEHPDAPRPSTKPLVSAGA